MPEAKKSVTARRRIRSEICWSAGESGSEKLLWLLSMKLFAVNYFFCALTPELSRAALRPRQSDNPTTLCRGREAGSA